MKYIIDQKLTKEQIETLLKAITDFAEQIRKAKLSE